MGVTVVTVLKFSGRGNLDVDGLTGVEASQATKTDTVYTKWTGDLLLDIKQAHGGRESTRLQSTVLMIISAPRARDHIAYQEVHNY